ncbi:MAG: helix-turn-helix transcriptional regulator [Solirubrobacteraceae bacterium]
MRRSLHDQNSVGAITASASETRRRELAAFLRSRRQRIDPSDRGFDPGIRRAPGLRREEVAALAGVSSSWYIRLEQARDIHPSVQVLTSIGRALSLNDAELEYLLRLGGHAPAESSTDRDDPQLQALMDGFLPNPASVLTPSFDYVAWNRTSEWIVPGFLGCEDARYNILRFLFSAQLAPGLVRDPDGPAWLVGQLRANAARHPNDAAIRAVAEELSDTSAEFARIWRRHEVGPAGPPLDVPIWHPDAGLLVFRPIGLRPELQPDLTLAVFLPSNEATAAALGRFTAHDPVASANSS